MNKIEIQESEKFKKEFKKLRKKYESLDRDFEFFKKFIEDTPFGDGTLHWNTLKKYEKKVIMKKRMMCRSLKSSSMRVIYYYDGDSIELECIEIYYKGNKESENKKRVEEIWQRKLAG